ncbi:MAG: hypothetical protein JSW34_00390 [Candidatus Zixiibacteriota bacterium]|nr:MAG: hypothetical protein JSW34_00390 [candidate division Zixibacteria bacterium]
MKTGTAIIILGTYMFAMGIVGLARTSSFTPLFISGGIAAVTIWLGWLFGQGMRSVRGVTLWWLALNAAILGYMAFEQVPAHGEPRPGSVLIFGSMAALSAITFFLVILSSSRRRPR